MRLALASSEIAKLPFSVCKCRCRPQSHRPHCKEFLLSFSKLASFFDKLCRQKILIQTMYFVKVEHQRTILITRIFICSGELPFIVYSVHPCRGVSRRFWHGIFQQLLFFFCSFSLAKTPL